MAQQVHRSPAYISRNRYAYCFRIRIPTDLQTMFGKKELRYSLRTGYLSTAKYKARLLAGRVQLLFHDLRQNRSRYMELSDEQIRDMVGGYLERERSKLINTPVKHWDHADEFKDYERIQSWCQYLSIQKESNQFFITTGDYQYVEDRAVKLLQEFGISPSDIDKDSIEFCKLCEGLYRADTEIAETELKILEGEDLIDSLSLNAQAPDYSSKKANKDDTSVPLGKLVENYWEDRSPRWKPRTLTGYLIPKKDLIENLGTDTPVHKINYNVMKDYRQRLIDKDLSPARVDFYIGFAAAVFN